MDPFRCRACGQCVRVCPQGIPVPGPGGLPQADPGGADRCIRCGHCAAVCPEDALAHRDLAPEAFAKAGAAPAAEEAARWLRRRRSVRAYQRRPVSRACLEALLEAARWAPTGHNARELGCVAVVTRPRREGLRDAVVGFYRRLFAVAGSSWGLAALGVFLGRGRARELRDARPGLLRAQERLRRGEDPLFHGAPAVLLFHAPPSETAEADAVAAAAQVTLFAPSLGLGTCYIGYASAVLRRFPRMARRWGVPRGRRVHAVLTVGFPAAEPVRVPPRPAVPLRLV
ncbi:MAG: nitroreductase family protein [Thermodesulfobacteriota bacterium]